MVELRVAGAQLPVTDDIASNAAAVSRAIVYAQSVGADVLLTPEGSVSGYRADFDPSALRVAVRGLAAQARDAGLALALGTCYVEDDGLCYNEVRFYDQRGQFTGFHSKQLRCGTLEDPPRGEITLYSAGPLRTFQVKGVVVGALICNDLWANPECTPMPDGHLVQQLARMGASVILHAVNGGRDGSEWSRVAWQYHEANLRMRARAGGVWIVTVDSCYPEHLPCSAPSGVVNPQGAWICRTEPQGEQTFVWTLTV
ncbi:MAG: carbon-nitrogen hydrolase family protein [Anaerolineae bacterium]|jgi:predicted amidohydrolase|nr:carbon-nitrogen hydrolase family protein [Anaerolineae bacterium]